MVGGGWWMCWTHGVSNVFCFDAGDDWVDGQLVCFVGLCGVAHGSCVVECSRRGRVGLIMDRHTVARVVPENEKANGSVVLDDNEGVASGVWYEETCWME